MKTYNSLITFTMLLIISSCGNDDNGAPKNENPPSSFSIIINGVTRSTAVVTWAAATDPDGDSVSYQILLNGTTVKEGLTALTYQLSDLTFNTEHTVIIIATDGRGGSSSQISEFTTLENLPPTMVDQISPLMGATKVDKAITFEYEVKNGDPEGDAIVYDVYLNDGVRETKIAEDLTETSFTYDAILGLNREYTWRVVAKDVLGAETQSESITFATRKANAERLAVDNFVLRQGHSTVLFNDNFLITGGSTIGTEESFANSQNSTDGISWNSVPANYTARTFHGSVVYDGKVWLFGGYNHQASTTLSSIYNISDISPESSWDLVTDSPGFKSRSAYTSVVFKDKMYLIGGTDISTSLASVLSSTDGLSWKTKTATAQFGPRSFHTSLVFNNKIWVIGGSDDGGGSTQLNDVWFSEDGKNWTQATEYAAFAPRNLHSAVVYDNKIWVYGGHGNFGSRLGDLWYSEDGVDWYEAGFEEGLGSDPVPEAVVSSSMVVRDGFIYVIGGKDEAGTYLDYVLKIY